MKQICCMAMLCLSFALSSRSQEKLWSEEDRKHLIDHLTRTRDLIIAETKNLSPAQWNFKESADRWSINQVVEHLAIWELLLEREITQALAAPPQPELVKTARQDSVILNFLMEDKQHITTEYTKPFTYTVPLGINTGENNLAWLLKMRNEAIAYVDTTTVDLRYHFLRAGKGSAHQVFLTISGHTDRHLRQIKKIKLNPDYPK